jgi:glucose-1-phosphate cytidylyltransferase
MQTVILCGGLGTRLKEETEYRPKPMVYIGPRPILWHIMKIYATFGHKEFILPLGYKGDMIKDYFLHYEVMNNDVTIELGKNEACHIHNSHEEIGWKITMVDTGPDTLKGGRINRIESYITDNTFLLTYGDGLANININRLIEFHYSHGKIATVTGINPIARFGELGIYGDTVTSFQEKPQFANNDSFVSGGFFVLNREIFDFLTDDIYCDFEFGALEELAKNGELKVYKHDGFWACMDTLRDMDYLNKIWESGKAEWKIW